MKRFISIALIMAMCLCLFAGCNDNTPADNTDGLASAKTYLFNVYNTAGKGEENKIVSDKDLTTVVLVGDNSYTVEWKVEITSGDAGSVILTESDKESNVLLKLVDRTNDIHFTLTATIKDSEGNSETLSLNCFTPLVEKIELSDGKVFLYSPNDSKFITSEMYVYTSSSGSTKNELVLTAESASAVQLTVRSNDDGSVTFVTDDGLYLFTDGTNTYFVDAESEEGYTNFILEAVSGGMLIKSQTAVYGGNAQYLEVYRGYLTCYSYQEAEAYLYTFQLIDAECEHTETVAVEAVAPTCTETGTTAGTKCTSCGLIMGVEVVDALGHTWGEWEVTTEATEAADGEKQRTCSVCGETETKSYELSKTEWVVVDTPEAETAYKFGMYQGNKEEYYYLTGAMNGYYMDTTTDVKTALSVYLESTEGGYYLYCYIGEAKTYINCVVNGTYVNGAYEATASTVYTFDAENKILVTTVNDAEYAFGTRSDNTYTTVGPVKTSNNGFHCALYIEQEVKNDKLTVEEAIAMGNTMEKDTYTEDKYYVTGVITEITNETYGNMYIADENGNKILVYGTYSADGNTRYDGLEVKPVAGDTVTVYGVVGKYNDAQIKNAWITTHTPAEGGECEHANTEDVEAVAPTCTEEGSTPGKKCTDCGAVIGVETVAALGHTWGEWETVKEPTETEDGEKKHVCSVCNAEETEPIQLVPTEWVVVEAPEAETAYKFGMYQGNKEAYYYLTGAMNGYYMDTTTDVKTALSVYLESTEGGYYLYCYIGEAKTYINCVVNGTHVNGAYEATASTVYTFDAENKILVTTIDDAEYAFGTRNDNTYTTVGPVKTSYNGFHCALYIEQEVQETEGEQTQKKNYVTDDGNVGLAVYDGYVDYFNFEKNVVEHGLAVTEENNTYSFVYARGSATVSFTMNEDGTVSLVDSNLGSFTLSEGEINGELGGETGEEGGETGGEAVGVPGTFTEAQQGTYSGRISAFGEFTLVIDDASAMLNLPSYEFEGFKGELSENDGRYVMMISEDENMTLIFTFDGDTISGAMTWFEDEPYAFTATKQVDAGITLVLADHAEANGWANETRHNEVQVDENITVTMSPADAQYTGNFYTKNNSWRLYQSDSGKLTITAAEGKTIVSVKITFTGKYTSDYLTDGTSEYASEALIMVNASTLTLSVGTHEAGKTNGQAQITTIEIVYE